MADPVPCSPLPDPGSLSDAARRLYEVLRVGGHTRECVAPQSLLATVLDLPVRAVQEDLALELLAAGIPVATTCGRRERCCPRCAGQGVVTDPPASTPSRPAW